MLTRSLIRTVRDMAGPFREWQPVIISGPSRGPASRQGRLARGDVVVGRERIRGVTARGEGTANVGQLHAADPREGRSLRSGAPSDSRILGPATRWNLSPRPVQPS